MTSINFSQRELAVRRILEDLQRGIDRCRCAACPATGPCGNDLEQAEICVNVQRWLDGDDRYPEPPASRLTGRNQDWTHVNGDAIFSMPDKWEYPWFAAWDLAFHTVTFALIDPEFAKQQLIQLGHVWYMHPNGRTARIRVELLRR